MTGIAIKCTPSPFFPKKLEACYEEMAQKGWILKEKGLIFDHFRYAEPQDLVYEIEYMRKNGSLENTQRRRRLKAGWDEVADRGMVHVYAADRDAAHDPMPEDNDLKKEQSGQFLSEALKWGGIALAAFIVFILALIPGRGGSMYQNLVTGTEVYLFIFALAVFTAFISVRQLILILRRRSINHSGKQEKTMTWRRGIALYTAVVVLILICIIVSGVLMAKFLSRSQEGSLPLSSDGLPIVLAEELEDVKRVSESESPEYVAEFSKSGSLLAPEMYYAYERCAGGGDYSVRTYQNYYKTVSRATALRLARDIAAHSVWTSNGEFTEISVDGYDLVLTSKYETVAVSGSVCLRIIYNGDLEPRVLLENVRDRL